MTDHSDHQEPAAHDHHMKETSEDAGRPASPSSHEGHGGGGHDKHAGHSVAKFRDRFWLSFLLSLPVVFFSEMIQEWFGYTAPSFPGSDWVAPGAGNMIELHKLGVRVARTITTPIATTAK